MKRLLPIFILCSLLYTTNTYSQNCTGNSDFVIRASDGTVLTDSITVCYELLPFTLEPSATTGTFNNLAGLLDNSNIYRPVIPGGLPFSTSTVKFTYTNNSSVCTKHVVIFFPDQMATILSPTDNSSGDDLIEVCTSDAPIPLQGNINSPNASFNTLNANNQIVPLPRQDSLLVSDLNDGINKIYYVYFDAGCRSIDSITIIKNPPPTFNCAALSDGMTICSSSGNIPLTNCQSARVTGPLVNINGTLLDPTLAPPDATYDHTITYLGNDCYDDVVETIRINVISEPRLAFESIGNACVDPINGIDTLVYTGDDVGPNAQFTWTLQDGSVVDNQNDTVIVSWNSAGEKIVQLDIEDSYCGNLTHSETLTKEGITLSVTADENPIFLGDDVELISDASSSSGSALSYFWSPIENLLSPNGSNTVAVPDSTTTYQLVVNDASGCTAIDSITITVVPDTRIFVPNVFTPNNDGQHDNFIITDNKIEDEGRLTVFDRWGGKVYETQDLRSGWDGTINGKFVNTGVYVYVLEVTFKDGLEEVRHGNVTVIR